MMIGPVIPPNEIRRIFPYHMVIDKELCVKDVGALVSRSFPQVESGASFSELIESSNIEEDLSWESLKRLVGRVLIITIRDSTIRLRGELVLLDDCSHLIFLCSPWISSFADLQTLGIGLSDLPAWEPVGDFLYLLKSMQISLEDSKELSARLRAGRKKLRAQNKELEKTNGELRAANKLIERQQREFQKMSLVAAQTSNSVLITDKTGSIEWANKAFCSRNDVEFHTVVGCPIDDVFLRCVTRDSEAVEIRDLLRTTVGFSEEVLHYTHKNRLIWGMLQIQPMLDAERNVIGFLIIETDITEKRLRDQEIIRQRDKLEKTLACIGDGVIVIDARGRVNLVNRAAELLMCKKSAEILGKNIDRVLKLGNNFDTSIQISDWMAKTDLIKETPTLVDWYNLTLDDGSERKVVVSGVPVEYGSSPEFLLVVRDVSDVVQMDTIKKDFVASVSHELRTPLTSLKGFILTMQRDLDMDVELRREFLGIMGKQSERLIGLVNDILQLSQLESTDQKLLIDEVRLGDFSESLLIGIVGTSEEYNIPVHLEVGSEESTVKFDVLKMESAVLNLLSNAIKFSKPDSVVNLSLTLEDNGLVISVADSGIGIPQAEIGRVFEKFHRVTSTSETVAGTGLGLSIVHRIIELHGGTIELQSELGKGTTFVLRIPQSD